MAQIASIPYPCDQDAVTPASIQAFAAGAEQALSGIWTGLNQGTKPPSASVRFTTNQNVATGVTATMNYNFVNWDTAGMFSFGSPTVLTIPIDGAYLVESRSSANVSGNVTSIRFAVLRNGSEYAYREFQNTGALVPTGAFTVSVLMPFMTAGETVSVTGLYTGTQPNLDFFGRLAAVNLTSL